MKYFIDPNNNLLTRHSQQSASLKKLAKNFEIILKKYSSITSTATYQKMVGDLVRDAKKNSIQTSKFTIHKKELGPITQKKPLTEPTVWGGVVLKKVDVAKDFIQKLLVINKSGVLGFEIHKQKVEKLVILEGHCLVFFSNHKSANWKSGKINVKLATVGDKFKFKPKDEHGVIALTDCVIQETSTNHLDDLFYIYKLSQV